MNEKIVVGGCGHSAENMEFSAVVVTVCIVGALVVLGIALVGKFF